jgi:hypothetical protein
LARGRTLGDAAAALMDSCPRSFEFVWDCLSSVTFMTSLLGHGAARALGVIRVPWIDFAPFYRHMKRLHGGGCAAVESSRTHSLKAPGFNSKAPGSVSTLEPVKWKNWFQSLVLSNGAPRVPLRHGGAYMRMVVSGQRHSAMDVLEHLDRREAGAAYECKSVDPPIAPESAWFQPLNLSSEKLDSNFAFQFLNLYRYSKVPTLIVTGGKDFSVSKAGLCTG